MSTETITTTYRAQWTYYADLGHGGDAEDWADEVAAAALAIKGAAAAVREAGGTMWRTDQAIGSDHFLVEIEADSEEAFIHALRTIFADELWREEVAHDPIDVEWGPIGTATIAREGRLVIARDAKGLLIARL